MSIFVLAIVKNAENNIIRMIESLKNLNIKKIFINDTGSTDNTIGILKNIPNVSLSLENWNNNFSDARNKLIDRAFSELSDEDKKENVYFLFADDDFVFNFDINPLEIVKNYTSLNYKLTISNIITNFKLIVKIWNIDLNRRLNWKYVGKLHEVIELFGEKDISYDTDINFLSLDDGIRTKNKHKYLDDAVLLIKELNEKISENIKWRYIFYIAMSLYNYESYDFAKYYFKLAVTGNYTVDYKYIINLYLGYIYKEKNKIEKSIHYFYSAYQLISLRCEAIIELLDCYIKTNNISQATKLVNVIINKPRIKSGLFVNIDSYNWELDEQFLVVYLLCGKKDEYISGIKKLISEKEIRNISDEDIERMIEDLDEVMKN